MRMLAKNELNHVSGATSEEILNAANISGTVRLQMIELKPDPSGSLVPSWTPNGSLSQDAWEGLMMVGYFSYKHFSTICAGVCSIAGSLFKK